MNCMSKKMLLLSGIPIVRDGLIAWWEHNEGAGIKIGEKVGGLEGTLCGTSSGFWVPNPTCGFYNLSYPNFLNGIGQGLAIPSGGITIVAAIMMHSVAAGAKTFLAKSDTGDVAGNYTLDALADEVRFWFVSSGPAYHVWSTTALDLVTYVWHILTLTYTFGTAGSLVLYDGDIPIAGSWTTGTGNAVPHATNEHVHLGAAGGALDDVTIINALHGRLKDVLLYNKALTAGDVGQNFSALRGRYSL